MAQSDRPDSITILQNDECALQKEAPLVSSELSSMRFSVIIPLEFHRGQGDKCLRAWVKDQTYPREQFEVIVACPEDFPREEYTALRALLAAHDRFLLLPGDHDMTLCEVAAREAKGEVLFFTESHVHPESDVLEVVHRAMLDHPEWAAFSCQSVPVTHNLLSQIEAELYDKDIQFAMNEHPWRKVLDQCFVIRKEPYFEAGGFESQYGHFAEWLLAARLYQLGYRVGYVPEARIHHYYIGHLSEWIEFTDDFVEGQMRYLANSQKSAGPELALFEEVPEWSARHQYRRSTAFRMVRMLWHAFSGREQSSEANTAEPKRKVTRQELLISLRRWSACAVLGAWRLILPSWLSWMRGQRELRRHLKRGNREGALQAYFQCWSKLVSLRRGRFLRRWAKQEDASPPARPKSSVLGLADIRFPGLATAPAGVGFHLGESVSGETLRWSEPVACVELPLAKGKYRVTLRWLPLQESPSVQFYFNEQPIPKEALRWKDDSVEIRLQSPARGNQRLGWICPPCHAPHDARALGVAVQSIAWRRDKKISPSRPASSLFFLHMRKTAGVAVRDALINRFPASSSPYFLAQPGDSRDPNVHPLVTGHVHYGFVKKLHEQPSIFTMLRDPLDRALSAYYFFRGHDQAKLDELKQFVPADEYAQRIEFLTKARQCSLAEFLAREPELARFHLGNLQTRQLLHAQVTGDLNETHLSEALKNLEDCDVIGLLERLPESIALLEHRMGWEGVGSIRPQNVTRERLPKQQVDPAALDILTSWNRLDDELYQRAQKIFEARLEAMRAKPPDVIASGAAHLTSARAFTPAQPIHGHGWYARERAGDRWICWMGTTSHAWLDLSVETLRDSQLTCTFPYAISPLSLELLQIQVNGLPVEHQRSHGPQEDIFECRVPASHLQRSPHRVRITFICRDRQRPCDLNQDSHDPRRLSLALGSIRLTPDSLRRWENLPSLHHHG
jgi:GT2 family glycosyltransferase